MLLLLLTCVWLTSKGEYYTSNVDYCFNCPFLSCDWCELVDDTWDNTLDPEGTGSGSKCTETGDKSVEIWTGDWQSVSGSALKKYQQILRALSTAMARVKMQTTLTRHIDCSHTARATTILQQVGYPGTFSDRSLAAYMGNEHVFSNYIIDFTLTQAGLNYSYTWNEDRDIYFNL